MLCMRCDTTDRAGSRNLYSVRVARASFLTSSLLVAAIAAIACGEPTARPPAIRFLHTFGRNETEVFNQVIAERGLAVESMLVPFARGQQVIGEILRARGECPDLIRIDATWLPELVISGLVVEPPPELAALDWLPEAAALAQLRGVWWGLPQSVDGLIVLRDAATPAPASTSLADLVTAARAARTPAAPFPLDVRVDGYWFVPWLRAEGGELAPDGIADDGAIRAMTRLAALFGDVSPPPPPPGGETPDEVRRWQAHEIAYWITGPWQFGELHDRSRIVVGALAHAPRGGQLLVVPRCARRPAEGWALAAELTSLASEIRFADAFAAVPTRRAALDASPTLSRAVYDALRDAQMLPRGPLTPLLFDDLNPALTAVVEHDATADEAVAGLRRGWHSLAPEPPPTTGGPR
jgi:ABC-type glycerol-3-phosphate transport system substrate-binding protein